MPFYTCTLVSLSRLQTPPHYSLFLLLNHALLPISSIPLFYNFPLCLLFVQFSLSKLCYASSSLHLSPSRLCYRPFSPSVLLVCYATPYTRTPSLATLLLSFLRTPYSFYTLLNMLLSFPLPSNLLIPSHFLPRLIINPRHPLPPSYFRLPSPLLRIALTFYGGGGGALFPF